jgi:hypothetical protein
MVVSNVQTSQRIVRGQKDPAYQGWVAPHTRVALPADVLEIDFCFRHYALIAVLLTSPEIDVSIDYVADRLNNLEVRGIKRDVYHIRPSTNARSEYQLNT